MNKVDLDSDIKLILRFLPIPEIELLKQITNELRAAREVVEAAREFDDVCSHGIYVNEKISHALLDYDEVVK